MQKLEQELAAAKQLAESNSQASLILNQMIDQGKAILDDNGMVQIVENNSGVNDSSLA